MWCKPTERLLWQKLQIVLRMVTRVMCHDTLLSNGFTFACVRDFLRATLRCVCNITGSCLCCTVRDHLCVFVLSSISLRRCRPADVDLQQQAPFFQVTAYSFQLPVGFSPAVAWIALRMLLIWCLSRATSLLSLWLISCGVCGRAVSVPQTSGSPWRCGCHSAAPFQGKHLHRGSMVAKSNLNK